MSADTPPKGALEMSSRCEKPRLLDLFCKAGGAAMGYYRAGFDVIGVDIEPQPRYPFAFLEADALDVMRGLLVGATVLGWRLDDFDAIHASPPCQRYSQMTPKKNREDHPDLIDSTRRLLESSELPFVIENVPSAAKLLKAPIMLCGSMFGLNLRRHRFFEVQPGLILVPDCAHKPAPVLITGTHRRSYEPRYEYSVEQCREAAGIDWMTRKELDECVPPAFTEYIGNALMRQLKETP